MFLSRGWVDGYSSVNLTGRESQSFSWRFYSEVMHLVNADWCDNKRRIWLILPARLKQRGQETKPPITMVRVSELAAVPGFLSPTHIPSSCPSTRAGGVLQPHPPTQTGNPVWRRRCTKTLSLSRFLFPGSLKDLLISLNNTVEPVMIHIHAKCDVGEREDVTRV